MSTVATEATASAAPTSNKACDVWSELDSKRQSMMERLERMASYTLPHVILPDGWQADEDGVNHDYQSIGAQAVNHLATKLMLTLFAPTRPFMRLDPTRELKLAAGRANFPLTELENVLAQAERESVRELDAMAARPKLFELLKHVIILGNSLLMLPEDAKKGEPRVLNLRRFVVKRSLDTKLHTVVIREQVKKDELAPEVRSLLPAKGDNETCSYYIMARRQADDKYIVTYAVDDLELSDKTKTYTAEELPFRVITWNLADYADYGTGLVEEYQGALAALSTLSAAIVRGAVLASEFRWLVNPAGLTTPEDFNNSRNGQALPGQEGDVTLVQAAAEVARAVDVTRSVAADYVNVIGRGFLMAGAVTRDAERVTAEEIRMLAAELETGLGGAYSRLAADLQLPLGRYLLRRIDVQFRGNEVRPTIVTGLDALSRNGDLEALRAYINDVATITALPEQVLRFLPLDTILSDLATGRQALFSHP